MTKERALYVDFKGDEYWVLGFDTINGVYYLDADEIQTHSDLIPVHEDEVFSAIKDAKEGKKYYVFVDHIALDKIGMDYGITGGLF